MVFLLGYAKVMIRPIFHFIGSISSYDWPGNHESDLATQGVEIKYPLPPQWLTPTYGWFATHLANTGCRYRLQGKHLVFGIVRPEAEQQEGTSAARGQSGGQEEMPF